MLKPRPNLGGILNSRRENTAGLVRQTEPETLLPTELKTAAGRRIMKGLDAKAHLPGSVCSEEPRTQRAAR